MKPRGAAWIPALLSALTILAAFPFRAHAGSFLQREFAPPDSTAGALVVETEPPGLLILVDEVEAGRSPIGPVWLPAKTVRVRALADDPRRFDTAQDEVQAVLRPGSTTRVFLDIRPSIMIRSTPEPARVLLLAAPDRDSLLGETPLAVQPGLLQRNRVRLLAPDHADTMMWGDTLIDRAETSGAAAVSLRRVAQTLPVAVRRPPLHRRRWFQWTLVATGAGLTGAAAILRREGDRWYDRYLDSSDRRVLDTYFDRAVRYDRFSLASLGVGQVLFTGGLVLLVSGSGP